MLPSVITDPVDLTPGILAETPDLKYYRYVGHYTWSALFRSDPAKALVFAREWIAATPDSPPWNEITNMIEYFSGTNPGPKWKSPMEFPKDVLIFGAECYQSQLDHYPWAMDFPATYDTLLPGSIVEFFPEAGIERLASEVERIVLEIVREAS